MERHHSSHSEIHTAEIPDFALLQRLAERGDDVSIPVENAEGGGVHYEIGWTLIGTHYVEADPSSVNEDELLVRVARRVTTQDNPQHIEYRDVPYDGFMKAREEEKRVEKELIENKGIHIYDPVDWNMARMVRLTAKSRENRHVQ
ncbi:MAG: hypothetical protein JWN33_612 [Candidatus Saccharibacteria bacterium]|nr:hypothetical protein [Candidatus Saccharibacteria bacterium]